MKRLSVLLLAVLTAGCLLTGCGGSNDAGTGGNKETDQNTNQDADNAGGNEEAYEGFVFVYNGTEIKLDAEMAPIIDALGEADSYFESESCAFQGLDKVYTYGSIVISTYPQNDVDYVNTIELKDDTVETKEGIYIGSSKDDVIAAYGTPTSDMETASIYDKGETRLTFIYADGVVESIIYAALSE